MCLLIREHDHTYAQPSLTRKTLRQLELMAGAPSQKGIKSGDLRRQRRDAPA